MEASVLLVRLGAVGVAEVRRLASALLLLSLLPPAWAEDKPAEKPPKPLTPEQAAERVLEAYEAKEDGALRALAEKDNPDPWLVADELIRRGGHDAAEVFANAAPRKDVETLPAYLAGRRDKPSEAAAREILHALSGALATKDYDVVLQASAALADDLETVARISVHYQRGIAYRELRRYEEGAQVFLAAAEATKKLGWWRRTEQAYQGSAYCAWCRSDYRGFLRYSEHRLAIARARHHQDGMATAYRSMGLACARLGNYGKALTYQQRARDLYAEMDDSVGVATALLDLGGTSFSLGRYPDSLEYQATALALWRKVGHRIGESASLGNLGLVHASLGDYPKALAYYEKSLTILEEESFERIGATLSLIGHTHLALGDCLKALAYHERALECEKAWGRRAGVASSLAALGTVRRAQGDHEAALAYFRQSLDAFAALDSLTGVGRVEGEIGHTYFLMGRHADAIRRLDPAVREARRHRQSSSLVRLLSIVARVQLAAGQPGLALAAAREALPHLEALLGGLGEEEAASARAQYADLLSAGALAAARLQKPAEMLEFLEGGRAGALLESLGGRQALRWTALPEDLLNAEAEAKAAEARARLEYDRVVREGNLRTVRSRAKTLDEARETIRELGTRIQREAKRAAGLFYPRAVTLAEIQGWLEPSQVLVLYGLCLDEALALVLRHDGERIVPLGTVEEVTTACEAIDASSAEVDPALAFAALKKLLVGKLELGPDVKQVLVSPEGPLCYLPFGALFERTVTMTPSGSTHVLLLDEEREPGTGILALGDPDYAGVSKGAQAIYYRGRTLAALPATGPEVKAVGTTTLLGTKASEVGLREAVSKTARWKAVHFACHGLIDVERPTLSSLALSGSQGEDGFLTALEVLRMEIPADLVVLSACETGKGKIVKGEGIVGLTRAFMFAGSPRVIASLWKVDDEATQALMIKFYELWNPKEGEGLGAATALQQAQAFIKSQEKWKHPYYWAAWVLWGLPR